MPNLTIRIPAEHAQDIFDSFAATYTVEDNLNGLRQHIIKHLRDTVGEHKRTLAAATGNINFDITWEDLEVT